MAQVHAKTIEAQGAIPPADWPQAGAIDLQVHDLPHASSTIEWWYVNSHIETSGGRRFSLFAAFFRVEANDEGEPLRYSHFLTWALTDVNQKKYYPCSLLDTKAPEDALRELRRDKISKDPRVRRALCELLERGSFPLPDRILQKSGIISLTELSFDLDGNCFRKLADGAYGLRLKGDQVGCELTFRIEKPVTRHGDEGVVRGVEGEDMFYYFSPRCRVNGSLFVHGETLPVREALGWYDHEFGEHRGERKKRDSKVGWNWLSAQLDNGYDISAYDLFDKQISGKSHGRWAIVIDPAGRRSSYQDFSLEPVSFWTSTKTFNRYPIRWRLRIPKAQIELEAEAELPEQELVTLLSAPAFWEGRVKLSGHFAGALCGGLGFVERSGASDVETLEEFFTAVGRETRMAIKELLPAQPTFAQALRLIGGPGREHFLDGVDLDQYARALLAPIREIVLRGGKAWRSYAVLAGIDVVGGDSQSFASWLALPELLHAGSLIVDDVQDSSEVRRGGPACHKLYGVPLAINAGNACYFLAMVPLQESQLPTATRQQVYEAYLEAMRAAHTGQAIDIDSMRDAVPEALRSGDGQKLWRRVMALHRLKSAVPPGALARAAALIGGGSAAQAESFGHFLEALGLAFQIIDDVLNLRGFENGQKTKAEDISEGKITAPVARALSLLPGEKAERLWQLIAAKPTEPALVKEALSLIETSGALEDCESYARELLESAWQKFDPLVPDSIAKVKLRAFGWFVLDRHY